MSSGFLLLFGNLVQLLPVCVSLSVSLSVCLSVRLSLPPPPPPPLRSRPPPRCIFLSLPPPSHLFLSVFHPPPPPRPLLICFSKATDVAFLQAQKQPNACTYAVVDAVCCRKCLAAAFFMNAAELQKEGEYVTVSLSLWSTRQFVAN